MSSIQVQHVAAERRVVVSVDGEAFTSYLYADDIAVLKKPVLYPLVAPGGVDVSRGYPLSPRRGETVDHPHHIGLWFNYGNVNGLDFWNNSDAIPSEKAARMGTIRHRGIDAMSSHANRSELAVRMEWVTHDGTVLLEEKTRFVFQAEENRRSIDRITTLHAASGAVTMEDNKEGLLGIRVRRSLEIPSDKPQRLVDASGKPSAEPILDNTGVAGHYLNSRGDTDHDVWAKRGTWCMLHGTVDGKAVAIAIFDHPENPGHPTYWHARGYGLFAVNPLGQKEFSKGAEHLGLVIQPGTPVTFRHRIMLAAGTPEAGSLDQEYARFAETR